MTVSARSLELRSVAQHVADALPATVEEVVLTGSVSRGVADAVSDIEMLVVTSGEPELEECFSFAAACGLSGLGTWGRQGEPTKRVSGLRDGVPVELVWWSHAHAQTAVDGIFEGNPPPRPTRLRTASPYARPGCSRTGRSGCATIRTSSRARRSRTRP
jgi:hypothetical protein